MDVLIISKQYQSGLGVDYNILAQFLDLKKYKIIKIDKKTNTSKYKNVYAKIFLEHILPDKLKSIKSVHTFFIPNIEMLTEWDVKLAPQTTVLCKTKNTYNLLPKSITDKKLIKYTSFCSSSRSKKDFNLAVHFGGTSFMKGTKRLLQTWIQANGFLDINPDIKLLVTSDIKLSRDVDIYWNSLNPVKRTTFNGRKLIHTTFKNIHFVKHLTKKDYDYYSTKAGFRIQPSLIEGYGHTVNEGRCNKSVTLTVNHAPMNELITESKCLIDVKEIKPSYNLFKRFKNLYTYLYKGNAKYAIFDSKSFIKKFSVLLNTPQNQLIKIANKQHKDYKLDAAYFKKNINELFNNIQGSSDLKDNGLQKVNQIHKKFKSLNVNVPNIKRTILIITKNNELMKYTRQIKGFNIIHIDKIPKLFTPVFIIITDCKLKSNPPCSYLLYYGKTNLIHFPISLNGKRSYQNTDIRSKELFNINDLNTLCNKLHNGSFNTDVKHIEIYNVGEHRFTNKPPTKNTHNYDDSYDLWVYANDTLIKKDAVNGFLYEKYMTACLSSFVPKNTIILDVGTNIGTVTLPLSRLHHSNIKVLSFEPFPNTYSVLSRNLLQNKCFNVTHMNCTVGDRIRKSITLSDEVVAVDYLDPTKTVQTMNINEKNDPVHYGAVHIGTGKTVVNMVTIDSLNLNKVSAIKVDVEGAEPLVFYGAQKTIKKYKPVIVFEYNDNKVSKDMIKTLKLDNKTARFNIIDYCRSLGYKDMYELHIDDYMLVPPNRKQIIKNTIAKFKPAYKFKRFNKNQIKGFNLYKFIKPRW